MNQELRPDADKLLDVVTRQNAREGRGKLKLFLGMAAGVGKTCAMLRAAKAKIEENRNVLIGLAETHNRKETIDLLADLPLLPLKKALVSDTEIYEFDLDEALRRKPEIIILDELPHTNAAGSRHPKRYNDVEELLAAGISVYTALNVQHVESIAKTVESITGVPIRERVPDIFLDKADEIELVDLVPDDLLKRLSEGKIYSPDAARNALQNFFRKENLVALRELALSYTANRVEQELNDYRSLLTITPDFRTAEKLIVAVSVSPYSESLIRLTRKLADDAGATWYAVHIETGKIYSEAQKKILSANFELAHHLGAETLTRVSDDLIKGLIQVAREKNATQIVVGKPLKRNWIQKIGEYLKGGAFLKRLLDHSENIDVHIATSKRTAGSLHLKSHLTSLQSPLKHYVASIAAIIVTALFSKYLVYYIGYESVGFVFLFTVNLLGLFYSTGPILLAAFLGAIIFDFFFIPPHFTFSIGRLSDYFMLLAYFTTAITTGVLMSRVRTKNRILLQREERLNSLYNFVKKLSRIRDIYELRETAAEILKRAFRANISLHSGENDSLIEILAPGSSGIKEKERGVALWVFKNRVPAGKFTSTLPNARATYYPLISGENIHGVLGVRMPRRTALSLDERENIYAYIRQITMAIERIKLTRAEQNFLMQKESERLSEILLQSVSHEIRSPLMALSASLETLQGNLTGEIKAEILHEAQESVSRLNLTVANLLDMSRLESGMLVLNLDWHDPQDILRSAIQSVSDQMGNIKFIAETDNSPSSIRVDFKLFEQIFINLFLNVKKHATGAQTIKITSEITEGYIIHIADNGCGLPPDFESIFKVFHRGKTLHSGLGLGLSICKGIIEAHGGKISAKNQPNGGACFSVQLPLERISQENLWQTQ